MCNGFGVYKDLEGYKYEGMWTDDHQNGQGVETWDNNGSKFSGNFTMNKKQGPGRFDWHDGSYYQGGFAENLFQGYGEYLFAEQEKTYFGNFE